MDSKVEDGEDSDMEDMAYMEEKKWKIGDSEELIRVQEISKTFHLSAKQQKLEHSTAKTKIAVNQVSFCVNRGEVFGLLGPNGAGKTTTLRMLATLIRPDSGDAVLSGSSVVTQPEEVRRKIGFLTSELKLEDFLPRIICMTFSLNCTVFRQTDEMPENACCLQGSAFRSLHRCASGICLRE